MKREQRILKGIDSRQASVDTQTMEILNSKEPDLGITQLESFFKVENDALIDCLAFDNSKKILDAVKNSLRTNMKKLAQLTLSLVNVERFQRLQVEQDSEKV